MFVDTHCHLTMIDKKIGPGDGVPIPEVVARADKANVKKIITIATTLEESMATIELAKQYNSVWATIGIHPCDGTELWKKDFEAMKALPREKGAESRVVVGVGETGLDFYWKPFFKQRQIDLFKAHIELALERDLPLVIHIRDSADEVLAVLEEYKDEARGVAHCFSQPADIAKVLLDWGFYLGIGGPVTYPKNDALRSLVAEVPLDRILLETDAPFLPPQQFRGKRNFPEYIPLIAQAVAEARGVPLSVVEEVTTDNVKVLFQI